MRPAPRPLVGAVGAPWTEADRWWWWWLVIATTDPVRSQRTACAIRPRSACAIVAVPSDLFLPTLYDHSPAPESIRSTHVSSQAATSLTCSSTCPGVALHQIAPIPCLAHQSAGCLHVDGSASHSLEQRPTDCVPHAFPVTGARFAQLGCIRYKLQYMMALKTQACQARRFRRDECLGPAGARKLPAAEGAHRRCLCSSIPETSSLRLSRIVFVPLQADTKFGRMAQQWLVVDGW